MSNRKIRPAIAVIGAGIAGTSCAAALLRAGHDVTLFEKSNNVGGRMATRRVQWTDASGVERSTDLDHGAQQFSAQSPRFRAVVARAEAAGQAEFWQQRVYAAFPEPRMRLRVMPVPDMPSFCRNLLGGVPMRMGQQVQRLQRGVDGWRLVFSDGESAGLFDHVMLAMPPAQAALLLAGHKDDWADALAAVPMTPCWTLMAVTDDVDWPWDAAEPENGPLAVVTRNDRKPGRDGAVGCASWVAHATAAWSEAHLEDDPKAVVQMLRAALTALMPPDSQREWQHVGVHRWLYASLGQPSSGRSECWWDPVIGLGVCGDSFGAGTVEAAWRSGDELADTVAASLDTELIAVEEIPQVMARVRIAQEIH